jgi:predicted TPR repeat methyltransferase
MKNKNKKTYSFWANRFKQITNAANVVGSLIPSSQKVYSQGKKEFSVWLEDARVKIKNPSNSNAELGHYFYNQGKISDALFRFKMANFMNKDPKLLFYIGKAYYSLRKVDQATEYLQDYYKLHPSSKEALYFLSLINKEYSNTSPTNDLIKENFNIFSEYFTELYIENINYLGDIKVFEAFSEDITSKSRHLNILDLGCGNGLIGSRVKESLPEISITGLDFAKEMIKICQDLEYEVKDDSLGSENEIIQNQSPKPKFRKTYDVLVSDDFENYIRSKSPKYQYILARGIIDYYASLNNFFNACSKALDEGGKLFFYSKEKYSTSTENTLKEERYFPYYLTPEFHNKEDIETSAKKAGMSILSSTEFELEHDIRATLYEVEKK